MSRSVVFGPATVMLACLLFASAALADVHRTREFTFDPGVIERVETASGVRLTFPEALTTAPTGSPDLPSSVMWVEIPDGYRLTDLRVESSDITSLGRIDIAAAQHAHRIDETPDTVLLSGLLVIVALSRAGSAIFWNTGDGAAMGKAAGPLPLSATALLILATAALMAAARPTAEFTRAAAVQVADRDAYVEAVLANTGVSTPASERTKP